MLRLPPTSTRTDTLFHDTTLVRSYIKQARIGNAPLDERIDQQIFLFGRLDAFRIAGFNGLKALIKTYYVLERRRELEIQAWFGDGVAHLAQSKDQRCVAFAYNEDAGRKNRQDNNQAD